VASPTPEQLLARARLILTVSRPRATRKPSDRKAEKIAAPADASDEPFFDDDISDLFR
jgi:hypothetical protein